MLMLTNIKVDFPSRRLLKIVVSLWGGGGGRCGGGEIATTCFSKEISGCCSLARDAETTTELRVEGQGLSVCVCGTDISVKSRRD